jgi:hypothetical protein
VIFEPTIPASERAKVVHASDSSATVTGPRSNLVHVNSRAKSPLHVFHILHFNKIYKFDGDLLHLTIIVFSPDSPATRSRRSIGSGRESSSMLTSVEGNAVQAFCTRKNTSK